MVAGTGADAALFPVFNPTLQSEKFDKAGTYIHHLCRNWQAYLISSSTIQPQHQRQY